MATGMRRSMIRACTTAILMILGLGTPGVAQKTTYFAGYGSGSIGSFSFHNSLFEFYFYEALWRQSDVNDRFTAGVWDPVRGYVGVGGYWAELTNPAIGFDPNWGSAWISVEPFGFDFLGGGFRGLAGFDPHKEDGFFYATSWYAASDPISTSAGDLLFSSVRNLTFQVGDNPPYVTPIPEPASVVLIGTGMVAVVLAASRRRRRMGLQA